MDKETKFNYVVHIVPHPDQKAAINYISQLVLERIFEEEVNKRGKE